tara:strand:+ start:207 stop:359 length:153 start_codon:yes stop_codon:yes gene_type:complete
MSEDVDKDDFIYLIKCIAEEASGLDQSSLTYGDCITVIRNSIPELKENKQ